MPLKSSLIFFYLKVALCNNAKFIFPTHDRTFKSYMKSDLWKHIVYIGPKLYFFCNKIKFQILQQP